MNCFKHFTRIVSTQQGTQKRFIELDRGMLTMHLKIKQKKINLKENNLIDIIWSK